MVLPDGLIKLALIDGGVCSDRVRVIGAVVTLF